MSEDDAERPREFRHSSRSGGIPRSGRVGLLIWKGLPLSELSSALTSPITSWRDRTG
ncbi:hypothetical protein [Microcystis sp. M061S2]|uniref:hypothetical protein n=1 Tax=Microcystis sp. M061S2 TaxID=2771171 RepID=UPI00258CA4A0|nr:hypothetical protein [Microcystis sp. M061S2]MCA2655987.1 hypothetical protein [Microcystis sp. M061S2]